MLYAIGDIHGMFDKIQALYERIKEHAARHPGPHKLIFLGDYIDRGPDSKSVIDFVMDDDGLFERIYLRGNHEVMFTECIDNQSWVDMQLFLRNGGYQTLESYGCIDEQGLFTFDDFIHLMPQVIERTEPLYDFAKNDCVWYHKHGGFVFVHAGFDPRRGGFIDSTPDHWVWVREPFLNASHPFYWSNDDREPIRVVHGHTPTKHPEILPNRINVDTGAVFGGIPMIGKNGRSGDAFGKLTCIAIEPVERAFEIIQS